MFAASAVEAGTERPVAFPGGSPKPQRQPAITRLPNGFFTVWTEGEAPASILGSYLPDGAANGEALTLAPKGTHGNRAPAIATAGDVALAVWIEDSATGFRVMGRRISSAGFVYYESAIIIATEPTFPVAGVEVAVASDGERFLVAWPAGDHQIRAARVDAASGAVLDTPSLAVSRQAEPRYGERWSPTVVWTGEFFYVAWLDDPRNSLLLTPPAPPVTWIDRALVTSQGSVVTAQNSQRLHESAGQPNGLTASYVNGVHLLAWAQETAGSCLRVMPVRDSGILLPPNPASLQCVAAGSVLGDAASVATPTGFTVAWEESGAAPAVHAARLNRDGLVMNPATKIVANALDPALSAHDGVPTLAYSRTVTDGVQAGMPRVFAMDIFDTPLKSRVRAVRPR